MSADSQRLKSALRRIVLESPELRDLLGDSNNRGDQASSSSIAQSDAQEASICCDGSSSGNANPGVDTRDADSESQDGLDPDDPADLTSGDGTLSGVTDCATGEPICFDGAGFIPPEDWDDPSSPPIDPTYEEGHFYTERDLVFFDYPCDKISATYFEPRSGSYQTLKLECGVTRCDGNPDKLSACDPDPEDILLDSWPSDGCTNIAIVNGSLVGSKYDPENDGSYSAPMDEIQLCSGGEQIGLKPAANGGWKTINASTDSGYLWDSHGRKIAHIDGNEYSDPDV